MMMIDRSIDDVRVLLWYSFLPSRDHDHSCSIRKSVCCLVEYELVLPVSDLPLCLYVYMPPSGYE
jgi:hypothetical protein